MGNKPTCQPKKNVQSGNVLTLLQHRMWVESGPSGFWLFDGAGLRADVGSRGCSCQVNFCCGAACMHPDRDPGSPGRGPDALGYAASQRTCGCVLCAPAHCGNFPPMSSGCAARWK